jgi:hypothetical protein
MSSIGHQALGPNEEEDGRSFTLFPVEIRLKIWKLALHCPRLIKIRSDDTREYWSDGQEGFVYRAKASAKHTGLLQVNAESRDVAVEVYKRMFIGNFQGRQIYFDPDIDIIYMENMSAMLSFLRGGDFVKPRDHHYDPDDMESEIQKVIVGGSSGMNFTYLTRFRRLSTIILQQPLDQVFGPSRESFRISIWGEFCYYWSDDWGETARIPDLQFLSVGDIRDLVNKR